MRFLTAKVSLLTAKIGSLVVALLMTGCMTKDQIDAGNQVAFHLSAVAGDLIGTASYLGTGLVGETGRNFHVHGHWCGAGFPSEDELKSKARFAPDRLGRVVAFVKRDIAPVDDVDLACARHDVCYSFVGRAPGNPSRGDCDVLLMCELFTLPYSRPEIIEPRTKVLAWAGGAKWRRLSSDCNAMGFKRDRQMQIIVESY